MAAQAVEGTGWQVGQADKGVCEIVGRICRQYGRWWARIKSAASGLMNVLFRREGVAVHAVDNLLALLMNLSPLSKLQQAFRLDLEQAVLAARKLSKIGASDGLLRSEKPSPPESSSTAEHQTLGMARPSLHPVLVETSRRDRLLASSVG